MKNKILIGIDYGSKIAGTTVISILQDGKISIQQSEKKGDADAFLHNILSTIPPAIIGFDAPLSLPGIYRGLPDCNDYFYRAGDKILKAMSPMFLGGLTARAMQLKAKLELLGHEVYEIYPAKIQEKIKLDSAIYKKDNTYLADAEMIVLKNLNVNQKIEVKNWHQLDSLLALLGAQRISENKAEIFGNESEGQIFI